MNLPDGVVLWRPAEAAAQPMTFDATLNVLDVRGLRPGSVAVPAACGLLLVSSEAARGAWAAHARDAAVAVVPDGGQPIAPGSALSQVHVRLGAAADPASIAAAEAAAAWARRAGVACGIEGARTPEALAVAARLGTAPLPGPGSVVLDLRPELERLEGCGLAEAGVPAVTSVAALASLTPDQYRAMATRPRVDPDTALREAVTTARERWALRLERWAEGAAPHVLVITSEAENLVEVRVHGPFGALHRAGAIAGYTVLRDGNFVFSTQTGGSPEPARFGAVWVQRSAEPSVLLLLRALGVAFVYDLDDLLTVSPSYRPPFSQEHRETVLEMVAAASLVSCATAGLARRLPVAMQKVVVTPNLAWEAPTVVTGAARWLVWASSDRPALAGSRGAVERAVRDFCRAHGIGVLCLGETAPSVFQRAGLRVETSGLLAYPQYLERLRRAAPGILVGPLETAGDADTQAFVDSKSDIKVIEARLAGLVGVFSRAAPYVESDLTPQVLCENTYEGWLEGLERARGLCARPGAVPGAAPGWPAWRDGGASGLAAWAAAVRGAATQVGAGDVQDALAYVRAQAQTPIGPPELFDEADYLQRHPDVAAAVAAGSAPSGYRHYLDFGFREGRAARALPAPEDATAPWWGRLLHRVGRLERSVASREITLARLQAWAAMSPALPSPAADDGVVWQPGGAVALPCPVCGAAGPHPVLLRREGQVLARCETCGACAAEERVVHAYDADPQAPVLLQLYLEQNAGIHQQTGLLFASAAQGSLLDVGCGFGFAVDMAARVLGWRAVGVDPSFQAAAGRRMLAADIRHATLTARMRLGERFAVVTASEVIEHLPEPYGFLALLRARLAVGGALVLTTPDAAALRPGIGPARSLAITAPLVHLVLFTAGSLERALRRAGFGWVQIAQVGDGLVAVAAEREMTPPADAALRHVSAYQRYLEGLMARSEPGSALWNGAAGRLLALLEPTAERAVLERLAGRIAAAWRDRFAIDLEALILPEPVAGENAAALAARQPLNLGPVLLRLARMARGERRLAAARASVRIAAHAERVLRAANMIDHDLRHTAAQAMALAGNRR